MYCCATVARTRQARELVKRAGRARNKLHMIINDFFDANIYGHFTREKLLASARANVKVIRKLNREGITFDRLADAGLELINIAIDFGQVDLVVSWVNTYAFGRLQARRDGVLSDVRKALWVILRAKTK